jgi:hypothetical protein
MTTEPADGALVSGPQCMTKTDELAAQITLPIYVSARLA